MKTTNFLFGIVLNRFFLIIYLFISNTHHIISYHITLWQYRDWQETRLGVQMSEMKKYVKTHPERNLSFTVHVGDIQKVANTQCVESSYKNVSTLLRKG
jgi:hypothetical protein